MKQKYTITVAGIELNVLSDGSAESVETVVASLDRKMREIFLRSPRCSKNEAALLCALDYCASHLAEEEHLSELEENAVKYQAQITRLETENAQLIAAIDKLAAEKRMLEESRVAGTGDAGSGDDSLKEGADARQDVSSVRAAATAQDRKGKKSRVGSMFDLLTFRDDV